MGKSISSVKSSNNERHWEDDVEWVEFSPGQIVGIRIIGLIEVMGRHWLKTAKKKVFPTWCPKFDSVSEDFDPNRSCPAHDDFDLFAQRVIIGNCIVRDLQKRNDPNPIRGFMLPSNIQKNLDVIYQLMGCDPADPENGYDLAIKDEPQAKPNVWTIAHGRQMALTLEEQKYKPYEFDKLMPNFADPQVASKQAKDMKLSMARNKHYVIRLPNIAEIDPANPWAAFKGDINGVRWTDIPELAKFESVTQTSSPISASSTPSTDEDDDIPDFSAKPATPAPAPVPASAPTTTADVTPPQAPIPMAPVVAPAPVAPAPVAPVAPTLTATVPSSPPTQPSATAPGTLQHPDGLETITWSDGSIVFKCFTQFDGKIKCSRCSIRNNCIKNIPED